MASGADTWTAAWEALRSGRPGEAERLGRAALATTRDSAEWWFLLGVACHAQGRPGEAADGYARALELRPDLPEAHNNLGNALRDLGRPDEAAECFRRALVLRPDLPEAHNNLGNALRDLGQLAQAAESYAQALRLRSDYPEAHNNLGNALRDLGRPDQAAECYRPALQLRPDYPEAHNNLGNALRDLGRPDEAAESYVRALRLQPDLAEAHYNLGNVLRILGRLADAVECLRQFLRLRPDLPEAHHDLGDALAELRRPTEAAECFRRALALRPDYPAAYNNLGNALSNLGRPEDAAECFRQALRLRSDLPEVHKNLGNALRDLGRLDQAAECFRQALALRPDYAEAHNNLGNVLLSQGQPQQAAECFRQALQFRPDYAEALHNLGVALGDLGRLDEAVGHFRRALELQPGHVDAHDGLLLTLHYRAGVTPKELAAAHHDYQRRHAAPLRASWRPFTNDRDPERPLRLGFDSPDLGRHPVGYFLVRAAEALAHRDCKVAYYSSRAGPDELTARFQAAASLWREVAGLTDAELADLLRADGIDVLIDLAGHTADNRLLVFARKPAPVQATWLGYVGTTGLEAIDWLVADDYLVPPWAEGHHRERVLRLPGGHTCYDAPAYAPDPGPPPALTSGRVTFGCFNNPAKLSTPALAAFAAVLRRLPASRLVLKYRGLDDPAVGRRVVEILAQGGIRPERVELRGRSAHAEHLAAYRDIDIALDPFPYGGVMTTCDALWMGVPVVTLPGDTFASRHGLGLLSVVGVADELVARDVDDYAQRAAGLAHDLHRLAKLRAGLRERMARSPLCGGERLADELLAALRTAWREWATNVSSSR